MKGTDFAPRQRPGRKGHTATYRGKRVYVLLTDGRSFVDRFLSRTASKDLIFEREGRVRAQTVAQFITSPSIIRAKTGEKA